MYEFRNNIDWDKVLIVLYWYFRYIFYVFFLNLWKFLIERKFCNGNEVWWCNLFCVLYDGLII